jgi:hypothetical protein
MDKKLTFFEVSPVPVKWLGHYVTITGNMVFGKVGGSWSVTAKRITDSGGAGSVEPSAKATVIEPYEKKLRRPVCEFTSISEITARLGSEDANGRLIYHDPKEVGSAIVYANGIYGVSYDYIPAISQQSRVGDPIRLCLVSVYVGCPKGDDRGKTYAAANLRTRGRWSLPDAEHRCGVA